MFKFLSTAFLVLTLCFQLLFGNEMLLSNHVTKKTDIKFWSFCKVGHIHKILLKTVERLKLVRKAGFLLTSLTALIVQTRSKSKTKTDQEYGLVLPLWLIFSLCQK